MRPSAIKLFANAALLAAFVAFYRDTVAQGQDFLVFYHAAKSGWLRQPIYDLARDGAMIFKYPPWIIPFFLPYSFFNESVAKCAWAVTQLLSLIYLLFWCKKSFKISLGMILLAFFLYWGIWVTHFLDGQVTLVFLAVSLVCISRAEKSIFFSALAGVLLTTKIYSFLAAVPLFWGREKSRVFYKVAVFFVMLSVLTSAVLIRHSEVPGLHGLFMLFKQWAQAAASGVRYLGEDKVLGRANQSLTALVLRGLWFGFPQVMLTIKSTLGVSADVFLGGLGFLLAGAYLIRIYDRFSFEIYFSISLALVPVIHPLPWIHGFALAFPIFAFVCAKTYENQRYKMLKIVAVFLLCIASRNTVGAMGEWLELFSAKGFGVLLLVFLATRSAAPKPIKSEN